MVRAAYLIAALAVVSPAVASDEPPAMRQAGAVATSDRTLLDLQGCVTLQIARGAKAVAIPIERGVEIDEVAQTILTKAVDPRFAVQIEDMGDRRSITAAYRHPNSAKAAWHHLRSIGRKCGFSVPDRQK